MKIELGMSAEYTKTIIDEDVGIFAELTGDYNSLHFENNDIFPDSGGRRVVHGMLVGSLFSGVLGGILPGDGTIYLEQSCRFVRPTFIGDTVRIVVTVDEIINVLKGIYRLETTAYNQDSEVLIEGYAIVKAN